MKKTLLRSAIIALTLTLLLPIRTFAQGGKPESPLHTEMEGMNHNLRLINRQYTDLTQKTNTLGLVAALQKHAETARTLTPPKAEKLTGDDQTKYINTFHNDLDALLKEIGLLKQAITDDKTDAAKAEISKIKQLEESSHKELGVDQGHKHGGPPPPASAPGQ